jgi:hypothetical protein
MMNLAYPLGHSRAAAGLMDSLASSFTSHPRSSFAIQELLGIGRSERSLISKHPAHDALLASPLYSARGGDGTITHGSSTAPPLVSWPLMAFSAGPHGPGQTMLGLAPTSDFYRPSPSSPKGTLTRIRNDSFTGSTFTS